MWERFSILYYTKLVPFMKQQQLENFFVKTENIRFNKNMPQPKIGDKIGKFTIIDDKVYRTEKVNHNHLKVKCDCGLEVIYSYSYLLKRERMGCTKCYIKYRQKKYKTIGRISANHFGNIKHGAIQRNLEFTLSAEFIDNLFTSQNGKCALTGIDLILFPCYKEHQRTDITASLDRIDSSKGYTEDNVQWVHKVINIMKGSLNNSEFINISKLVAKHNSEYQDNFEPSQLNGPMKRFLFNTFQRSKLKGATTNE